MSALAATRQVNINLTLFRTIRTRFENVSPASFVGVGSDTYAGRIGYNNPRFDPRGRDPRKTALAWWLAVRLVSGGSRTRRPSTYEVGAYFEVGHDGNAATRDPFMAKCQAIMDDFDEKVWSPNDRGIFVLDFAIPAAPVPTDGWIRCIDGDGNFGAGPRQLIDDGTDVVRCVALYDVYTNLATTRMTQYR